MVCLCLCYSVVSLLFKGHVTKDEEMKELKSIQSSDVYLNQKPCINGSLPLVSAEELTQLNNDHSEEDELEPVLRK